MGDAETAGEADLVHRYGRALRSVVVKVGHHGSRTSSTPALVGASAVPNGWAIVQVARLNRYGLPDEEPLQRWASAGLHVVSTSSEGAVWLHSDGRRFRRVAWRSE
jgi:competence protein ComEC